MVYLGGLEMMFCPTWGWLCWWQGLWVWPLDTDHLMSSPLYIFHSLTSSDHGGAENKTFLHPEVYILLNDPLWVCYLCKFDWFKQTLRNFHLVSKFQSKYWQTEKAKKKWNFSVSFPIHEVDVFACCVNFLYGWMYLVLHIPSIPSTSLKACQYVKSRPLVWASWKVVSPTLLVSFTFLDPCRLNSDSHEVLYKVLKLEFFM